MAKYATAEKSEKLVADALEKINGAIKDLHDAAAYSPFREEHEELEDWAQHLKKELGNFRSGKKHL